jgi:anaerobic ribonucleoside-triphosphate reductase
MADKDNIIITDDNDRTVCEVWTRVMGYYRPISAFNKGKQSEYYERKCFSEEQAIKK